MEHMFDNTHGNNARYYWLSKGAANVNLDIHFPDKVYVNYIVIDPIGSHSHSAHYTILTLNSTGDWNAVSKAAPVETSGTTGLSYDCNCYLNRYNDLRQAFGTDCAQAWNHWQTHGKGENRNPSCEMQSSDTEVMTNNHASNQLDTHSISDCVHGIRIQLRRWRGSYVSLDEVEIYSFQPKHLEQVSTFTGTMTAYGGRSTPNSAFYAGAGTIYQDCGTIYDTLIIKNNNAPNSAYTVLSDDGVLNYKINNVTVASGGRLALLPLHRRSTKMSAITLEINVLHGDRYGTILVDPYTNVILYGSKESFATKNEDLFSNSMIESTVLTQETGGGFVSVQNRKYYIGESLNLKVNVEVEPNSSVIVPQNLAIDGVKLQLKDRIQNVDKMEVLPGSVLDVYPLSSTDTYIFSQFTVHYGGKVYLWGRESTKYFKTKTFQLGYKQPLAPPTIQDAIFEVFGKFQLETENLEILKGGKIVGSGRGYEYKQGPGSSQQVNEGGSHGGSGGRMDHTMSSRRGTPLLGYGNFKYPTTMGSGGYVQSVNSNILLNHYSNGGAAVQLNIANIAYVDGEINVQGVRNYYDHANYDTGGAGGSVYINTSSIVGSGLINANGGGNGGQRKSGGGGGRIAVHCRNQTVSADADDGKCGKRINKCVPSFTNVSLGLETEFGNWFDFGISRLRNIDRISRPEADPLTASIGSLITSDSDINGIQFRIPHETKEISVGFMPADEKVSKVYHGQKFGLAIDSTGYVWIIDSTSMIGMNDAPPSIEKSSRYALGVPALFAQLAH